MRSVEEKGGVPRRHVTRWSRVLLRRTPRGAPGGTLREGLRGHVLALREGLRAARSERASEAVFGGVVVAVS